MPQFFKTRVNPNWSALIGALGESDQNLLDLIQQVRAQFFVDTAQRPYLDTLGANVKVSRPRFIGMDDPTFQTYIPILAYQPKQVKLILDLLLNIFFFKQTTTAFIQSSVGQPFNLVDGYDLQYTVDQTKLESIVFHASDFTNIAAATAAEVASAINRQAQYSFAIVYDNHITKQQQIQIFTTTIGSKGSIQLTGGLADIGMEFNGYVNGAGSTPTTVWTVSKVGDTMTFQWTGGGNPNLNETQVADVVIMSIPGNIGSFPITALDLSTNSFSFTNTFGTAGTFNHALMSANSNVVFSVSEKIVVFTQESRALVWEVTPGEIIVEMPATPPVVKRSLIGSAHLNGIVNTVTAIDSSTSLTLDDSSGWPPAGIFVLEPIEQIQTHILTQSENTTRINNMNTRFDITQRYTYTSNVGNVLSGITPNLPTVAGLNEYDIVSADRTGYVVTVTTSTPNNYVVGDAVNIQNVTPDTDNTINGTFVVQSIISDTVFTYTAAGVAGTNTGGVSRTEYMGVANSGSYAFLTTAQINTGIYGPYMWDPAAAFVLSSLTSTITAPINAGNNVRTVLINPVNNIPNESGYLIFDFGTEFQEGPVKFLYKPSVSTIQLDPSYIFEFNHEMGSSITAISTRGAHVMSGLGTEYPAYITDPAVALDTLETLMTQVKSSGIFIEFLIRYPKQLYSALDVYFSGNPALWPITPQ
jgi:hypothetical protein